MTRNLKTINKRKNQTLVAGLLVCGIPLTVIGYMLIETAPTFALLAYCLIYVGIAASQPRLGLMILFAVTPFVVDLSAGGPAKLSIAEITLMLAVPVCLFRVMADRRRVRIGPVLKPVLLYFTVCVISMVLFWRKSALLSLFQMVEYLMLAVMVFNSWLPDPAELRSCLYAALAIGVPFSALGLGSGFTFAGINKNSWGASLASLVIITAELWLSAKSPRERRYYAFFLLLFSGSMVLTLSRGAWLGAMGGLVILAVLRRQFSLLLHVGVLVLPLFLVLWVQMPQQQKDYAFEFTAKRENIASRVRSFEYTRNLFEESPLIGNGLGLRKEFDATNVIMSTLAETGLMGLIGFLLIQVTVWRMAMTNARALEPADPLFSLSAVGLALIVGRLTHGMVDHYWSRGTLLQAWSACGMLTAVWYYQRRGNTPRRGPLRPASILPVRPQDAKGRS